MSHNPYEPPKHDAPVTGVLSGQVSDLRSLAISQKGILICILITLCCIPLLLLLPPEIKFLVGVVWLFTAVVGAVFTFLMAIKVYGTGQGVLMGVLTLIPYVGFIILLIANGRATNVLKANGYKVGLLGAKISEIKE